MSHAQPTSPPRDLEPASAPEAPKRSRVVLELIAAFKFVKAAALIAGGIAAFGLLSPANANWAQAWLERLALGTGHRFIAEAAQHAMPALDNAKPHHLIALGVGAFLYAAVFLVEGVGLFRARPWAEYLTIGVTTSFLPFEIIAVTHRSTLPRVATLVFNIAIVIYLAWELRQKRRDAAMSAGQ